MITDIEAALTTRWRYISFTVLEFNLEQELNNHGLKGWELASLVNEGVNTTIIDNPVVYRVVMKAPLWVVVHDDGTVDTFQVQPNFTNE